MLTLAAVLKNSESSPLCSVEGSLCQVATTANVMPCHYTVETSFLIRDTREDSLNLLT
jgi:hypothetical protein